MAGNNLVYQTIQLNCDKEYQAEPLDFTGIRTIKLTDKPTDVQVWISSENTGANLFPLINRGDGWVNIDEPLQNVYIYTKGTNIQGDQLVLNVTGQKDIFNYGNNSSERIDKVGLIEGFSPKALMDLNNAIYNLYNKPKLVTSLLFNGQINTSGNIEVMSLPLKNGIASLNLRDDRFYKFEIIGHSDVGGGEDEGGVGNGSYTGISLMHLCLFSNTNNAVFTPFEADFTNIFSVDKQPWVSEKTDLFDILGIKYDAFQYVNSPIMTSTRIEDKGFNFTNNIVISGNLINKYENFGLHHKTINYIHTTYMHCSFLVNLYEMQDPTQWNS